ncbi:MAG: FkbM family methyltransferase [Longimicrobiales bacterium]
MLERLLVAALHRWRFFRGEYSLTQRLAPLLLGRSNPRRIARLRSGVRLEVDTSDYNGRAVYLMGGYELGVTEACRILMPDGGIFLDIGANCGAVGLNLLDAVGEAGEVHLFEPQPFLVEGIAQAAAGIERPQVVVHAVALTDHDGAIRLSVPAGHSGAATLAGADGTNTTEVEGRAADAYLARFDGVRPIGVKVDVEGAEPQVLPSVFALAGLRFVVFECNRRENQSAIYDEAERQGVHLFSLVLKPSQVQVLRLKQVEEMGDSEDFIAIPMRCLAPERIGDGPIPLREVNAMIVNR